MVAGVWMAGCSQQTGTETAAQQGVPVQGGELVYLEQQLTAFSLASLENPLFGPGSTRAVLEGLADLLVAISEAAGAVSDHLGLRFFAHVDVSQRTQSS